MKNEQLHFRNIFTIEQLSTAILKVQKLSQKRAQITQMMKNAQLPCTDLHLLVATFYMEQSVKKLINCSDKIFCLLQNLKVHYNIHNSPLYWAILLHRYRCILCNYNQLHLSDMVAKAVLSTALMLMLMVDKQWCSTKD
jgi:hypothetical protein